jgi:hypothetical protein
MSESDYRFLLGVMIGLRLGFQLCGRAVPR